jgi:hypothetical protein
MKLIDKTIQFQRKGKMIISFSSKGVIRISKCLVELMKLKPGNFIRFYQDEENPDDWYIRKEKDGIELRPNAGTTALLCNLASVSSEMMKYSKSSTGVSMIVSSDPINNYYYLIITKSAV